MDGYHERVMRARHTERSIYTQRSVYGLLRQKGLITTLKTVTKTVKGLTVADVAQLTAGWE